MQMREYAQAKRVLEVSCIKGMIKDKKRQLYLVNYPVQKRHVMGLAYHGKHYHGWQIQPEDISVQAKVQDALKQFSLNDVSIVCAGRTIVGCTRHNGAFILIQMLRDHRIVGSKAPMHFYLMIFKFFGIKSLMMIFMRDSLQFPDVTVIS